jgi:hypothetical protein
MRTKKLTERQVEGLQAAGYTISADGEVATVTVSTDDEAATVGGTIELIQPAHRSAPIVTVTLPDGSILDRKLVGKLNAAHNS